MWRELTARLPYTYSRALGDSNGDKTLLLWLPLAAGVRQSPGCPSRGTTWAAAPVDSPPHPELGQPILISWARWGHSGSLLEGPSSQLEEVWQGGSRPTKCLSAVGSGRRAPEKELRRHWYTFSHPPETPVSVERTPKGSPLLTESWCIPTYNNRDTS